MNINLVSAEYVITVDYNAIRLSNNITIVPTPNTEYLSMPYRDESTFYVTVLNGRAVLWQELM